MRLRPIRQKNGRGQMGDFPIDNLRAPDEIRLFRPSGGPKKIFRLLTKFADNEPILCITDQTNIDNRGYSIKHVKVILKPAQKLFAPKIVYLICSYLITLSNDGMLFFSGMSTRVKPPKVTSFRTHI